MSRPETIILPATTRSAAIERLLRGMGSGMADWAPSGRQLRTVRLIADSAGALRNPFTARTRRLRSGPVRGLWVCSGPSSSHPREVILYLHGGGYFFGSTRSHYGLAKRLSAAGDCAVLLLDYPLAPEHPYPAAADAALDAYRFLLDTGFAPESIALAGDSAGGHLAAALLADLHRAGLPMPAAAALFSPLVDMSGEMSALRNLRHPDPVLPWAFGAAGVRAYLGEVPPADPRVDLLAMDKSGWPPLLIQVGSREILLDEAIALARTVDESGRSCELQIWPGQVHVFQVLARVLPQGRAAVHYAAAFLRQRMEAAPSATVAPEQRSA